MNICQAEAELFHAGGRTDMTKLTVHFGNFTNASKNSKHLSALFSPIIRKTVVK
jgi:hypothetical protein